MHSLLTNGARVIAVNPSGQLHSVASLGCGLGTVCSSGTGGHGNGQSTPTIHGSSFCWSPEYLHIRFVCQDDYVVSDFTERDQPLYEQDVVELFIDEHGDGRNYIELEVSPHNVIFDALIHNNGDGSELITDVTWQLEGLQTAVEVDRQGHRVYLIHIPAINFKSPLMKGVCWKVNVYRIDENVQGEREYQAWKPTGAVNFHIPARFGHLQLG